LIIFDYAEGYFLVGRTTMEADWVCAVCCWQEASTTPIMAQLAIIYFFIVFLFLLKMLRHTTVVCLSKSG
jgi:hypothetical protein